MLSNSRSKRSKILMFPWLAHGHISPYLELAKKFAERNFTVYVCSTPATLKSIAQKIENLSISIRVIELNLPSSDLDPQYHTTNGLPCELMPTLKEAFRKGSSEFYRILKDLKPDLLIYDFLQPWAPAAASELNIPAVVFVTCSAASIALHFHQRKHPGLDFPYPAIYYRDYERAERKKKLEGMSVEEIEEGRKALEECIQRSCDIVLINSFEGVEAKYCEYFSNLFGKKTVPVGPLVQAPSDKGGCINDDNVALLKWLEQQRRYSTVFVAFGSEYFLKKEDIIEIAHGLELSNVNFIWVLRFPKGCDTDLEEALPQGFLERVGDRGKIVKGWAPQARILNHYAIGGFVSHCGWSSILESLKLGVPIIAMPMHLDQPINARLVVDVGVGVEVVRGKDGKIQRQEIAAAIKHVLNDEENNNSGNGFRAKAEEMRMEIRCNGEKDIDIVEEEMMKLFGKYKTNNGAAGGLRMAVSNVFSRLESLFGSFLIDSCNV